MKRAILALLCLAFALPAFAQCPPNCGADLTIPRHLTYGDGTGNAISLEPGELRAVPIWWFAFEPFNIMNIVVHDAEFEGSSATYRVVGIANGPDWNNDFTKSIWFNYPGPWGYDGQHRIELVNNNGDQCDQQLHGNAVLWLNGIDTHQPLHILDIIIQGVELGTDDLDLDQDCTGQGCACPQATSFISGLTWQSCGYGGFNSWNLPMQDPDDPCYGSGPYGVTGSNRFFQEAAMSTPRLFNVPKPIVVEVQGGGGPCRGCGLEKVNDIEATHDWVIWRPDVLTAIAETTWGEVKNFYNPEDNE